MPGSNTVAGVFNLRPATTYHLRIVAENEIGESEPSDTVTIITAEEGEWETLCFVLNLPQICQNFTIPNLVPSKGQI